MMKLTRILFLLLAAAAAFFAIRRSRIRHKKRTFFLILAVCAVAAALSLEFPIENLFVRFDSPERAFHYMESKEIEHVLYGKDSVFVIYKIGASTYSHEALQRDAEGYKLPGSYELQQAASAGVLDSTEVYRVKGTQDYYVCGVSTAGMAEFDVGVFRKDGTPLDDGVYILPESPFYFCWLDGPPEEFYLMADGQRIDFSEE